MNKEPNDKQINEALDSLLNKPAFEPTVRVAGESNRRDAKARIVDKDKVSDRPADEDFHRPDHPDFMTASELTDLEFSGMRFNSVTEDTELWILGVMVDRVTKVMLSMNPKAINQMMEEQLGLYKAMPDTQLARDAEDLLADIREQEEVKAKGTIIISSSLPKN